MVISDRLDIHMGWFSSKKKPTVTSQDKAILDLKLQRDKLRQYQKQLEVVKGREHELAKECLAKGDKKRALIFLKKKRYQEQMLTRTEEQMASLQELASNIEFALVSKDVLKGLEQGNKVLKELNAEMSLSRIEQIMDETSEGIAHQEQVSAMLSENMTAIDEDEVQMELEELEALVAGPKIPQEAPVSLPKAPVHEPQEPERVEQEPMFA